LAPSPHAPYTARRRTRLAGAPVGIRTVRHTPRRRPPVLSLTPPSPTTAIHTSALAHRPRHIGN
jgi:hypothetical protein